MIKGKQTIFWKILMTGCVVLTSCDPEKLFTEVSIEHSHVDFINQLTETEEININQYLYAHNGGGVSIGDINNDGLPDIYFTANQLPNKLYLNKGDFIFEDITEKANVAGLSGPTSWTTGVVMVDINHDGWLDIYVSQVANYRSFTGKNQLYINNGDLTFTEKANQYGLDFETHSQQAAFFDYDLDGDLDMYHLNHGVHNPDVYGKADIRFQRDFLAGDRLMRNDNGSFHDVSEEAGIYGGAIGYGLAVGVGDLDNNGCPDIFVSNDFHENDYVYYNNCDGTFREDIKGTLGHTSTFSMGSDIADFNNDGLLDIITLDMKPDDEIIRKKSAGTDPYEIYNYKLSYGYFYQYPRNMLQLNRGNLFANNVQFSEIGQLAGLDATDWSWSALMTDLDNDGWKDVFITNGILRRPIDLDYIHYTYDDENVAKNKSSLELAYKMPDGAVHNYAFKNSGKLVFEDVSSLWGFDEIGYSMGTAYGDLDNDGDQDLVINNLNAPASIYKNNIESLNENSFVKVILKGEGENTFAVGASVVIETELTKMTQVVSPTRGWLSSVDYTLTFGLGNAEAIKKLEVTWPDGRVITMENPGMNQTHVLLQKNAVAKDFSKSLAMRNPFVRNITESSGISFVHLENSSNDFSIEPLMPHQLSSEGPPIAVGDINQDGYDDFYIGGASGQAGELYYQTVGDSVSFRKYHTNLFEADRNQEDTGATFFDADGDDDLDLFVVSGGYQNMFGSLNENRLYINDGNGSFERSSQKFPKATTMSSCVVAADFNNDGRNDLFVGTRAIQGKYGVSPDSYLFWNEGNEQFRLDTTQNSPLHALGMVTSAVWLSESKELAIVGEWMPITFLKFHNRKMEKRELNGTSGWWNTIHADDLDGDGDLDLLAGNLGLNSNLRATSKEPVKLYVRDFDDNATTESLLTYYRQGEEWIFPGLDEIKKQMPSIRYRYNDYTSFANSRFAEVFSKEVIGSAITKQVTMLASVVMINHGNSEYEIKPLPVEAQFSPIYAFVTSDINADGIPDILAAGNFYGSTPEIGRFDASYGNCFFSSSDMNFTPIEPGSSGFSIYGEVRCMKALKSARSDKILVSRNNASPRLFTISDQQHDLALKMNNK